MNVPVTQLVICLGWDVTFTGLDVTYVVDVEKKSSAIFHLYLLARTDGLGCNPRSRAYNIGLNGKVISNGGRHNLVKPSSGWPKRDGCYASGHPGGGCISQVC